MADDIPVTQGSGNVLADLAFDNPEEERLLAQRLCTERLEAALLARIQDTTMTTMAYNGYQAFVEFDEEATIFHGIVMSLRDVITFQGSSVVELKQAFAESIKDYLAFCNERGENPEEPFFGQLKQTIE